MVWVLGEAADLLWRALWHAGWVSPLLVLIGGVVFVWGVREIRRELAAARTEGGQS